MTPQQLATLKAAIIADPVAGPIRTAGDTYSLLEWCNGPSTTSAWRISVTGGEIYNAHKPVEYIARSAAERLAIWTGVVRRPGTADRDRTLRVCNYIVGILI